MPPPENMSISEKCAFLAGELVKQSEPIFDPPVFEADKTPFTFPMPTGVVPVGGAGAAGAGVGALIGALRAPKGKMLKYTLGGAGIGGLAGMGSAAGYNLGSGLFDTGEKSLHPAAPIRLPLALGGGAVAAHLGNKLYNEVEHHIPEKEDKKDKKNKKNKKDEKAASAESLLFKNPYVTRSADFGKSPTATQLDNSTSPSLGGTFGNLPLWMLTGGGVGGLIGAASAEKGKRLRGALRGGAIGSAAGLFGQMGAHAGGAFGDIEMAYHGKPHTEFSTPARAGTVAAPYALAGASALLGGHMMAPVYDKSVQDGEEATRKYHEDNKKKNKKDEKDEKAAQLRNFGAMIANGYKESQSMTKTQSARMSHHGMDMTALGMLGGVRGAEVGGLAGLVGGGLHGAISPGNISRYDSKGNVTGQKRRHRAMGALRGSLGYGALGAGGGAAVGGLGGVALENIRPGTLADTIGPELYFKLHAEKAKRDVTEDATSLMRRFGLKPPQ